ncbi:MAG: penicillin-binding protein activator [Alphaproteobacteria bacterium]|nr:penicillin-binding protein activator [Alphaproteobacteria bacterium]
MFFAYRGPGHKLGRCFAIAALFGIAALAGCAQPPPPPPPPAPVIEAPPPPPPPEEPPAPNQLSQDQANFLRLPNLPNGTPVRVGVILPLTSTNAATRALAQSMLKAAQLALFDGGNANMVLMVDDEGNGGASAAAAAGRLLAQGAEVIVGPLFGPSVSAVAPVARDRGVPVLAFSTEKAVAGRGVYLISFLPENEVDRVVGYAAGKGHKDFAALVPRTAYGELAANAMKDAVAAAGGRIVEVDQFTPTTAAAMEPAAKVAKAGADAVLVAQGGAVLRGIAATMTAGGNHVQLLGTGLWDDAGLARETALEGGWYAAPEPNADANFIAKYRAAFGAAPANIASLAYDAVALVALLSQGEPYHRFTRAALMDANGFTGVSGAFRFRADGTSERGLAVLEMERDGPKVIDPAPKTFQQHRGS